MKRGEIWTVASGGDFVGKPRPAVVVQADEFHAMPSVTICPLTSDDTQTRTTRVAVEPSASNGLRAPSRLLTDKLTTVGRRRLGRKIGSLDDPDLRRLEQAMIVFLGLADTR